MIGPLLPKSLSYSKPLPPEATSVPVNSSQVSHVSQVQSGPVRSSQKGQLLAPMSIVAPGGRTLNSAEIKGTANFLPSRLQAPASLKVARNGNVTSYFARSNSHIHHTVPLV